MNWVRYNLKYQLISPIHIGYRKIGNLMETRPYVPGKNLWAALTARLTRDAGLRDYINVGKKVHNNFRFGYLWPSINGIDPYYPWQSKGDFEYLLCGSYSSTPLDCSTKSASEGGLHEVEFIAPTTRKKDAVHLLGDLWVRDGSMDESIWQNALRNIQLGGERSYGWGRLACYSNWMSGQSEKGRTISGFRWEEQNEEIILKLKKGDIINAHASPILTSTEVLTGHMEPLVGREWGEYSGQHPRFGGIFFVPGSKVNQNGTDPDARFRIGNNGLWHPYT